MGPLRQPHLQQEKDKVKENIMKKLLYISLGFLLSCNPTNEKPELNSTKSVDINSKDRDGYFSREKVEKLKAKCEQEGDPEAFGNLVDFYANTPSQQDELLPIAIIMADKYDNDNARVTIYYQMIMKNNSGKREDSLFFKLKLEDQNFIVSHLIDGVKNKNPGCTAILKKIVERGYQINNKEIEKQLKL
jgi:hypothetical protein